MLVWRDQGESDVFSSRYMSTPQTSYIIRAGQGKRSLDAIVGRFGETASEGRPSLQPAVGRPGPRFCA